MSITDTQKVDFLWKKVLFNVTTSQVNVKQATEEIVSSPSITYGDSIWSDSQNIPVPAITNAVVRQLLVKCKGDPTVPNYRTWICVNDFVQSPLDETNQIRNWVSPSFDPSYLIKVYIGNPDDIGNPAIQINATNSGNEYVFDYSAGVLTFVNTIPNLVGTRGIWVKGYQYIGEIGVVKPSDITDFLKHISDDLNPKLGGNLDVNDFTITSNSNGNIIIIPDGHGQLQLVSNIWPYTDGVYGDVLTTSGSGYLNWDTRLKYVQDDKDPVLGGDLYLDTYKITNYPNKDIYITAQGTGKIHLGLFIIPSTDGTANQIIATDGAGNLFWKNDEGLRHVYEDTSPILGGDLDVKNFKIFSSLDTVTINAKTLKLNDENWPQTDGTIAQVLATDGTGNLYWTNCMYRLFDDKTPKLGGNLDVGEFIITSSNNGDVIIVPDGTGKLQLGMDIWPFHDGNYGDVLVTNGSGYLDWDVRLKHVQDDLNPILGGDLYLSDYTITNDPDKNIFILPQGMGKIYLSFSAWPDFDGLPAQVLTTDGSGNLYWSDGGSGNMSTVFDDKTPKLGGDLNVNDFKIIGNLDKNIDIETSGLGSIILNGEVWPSIDGQPKTVLTTDGNKNLSWSKVDVLEHPTSGSFDQSLNGTTPAVLTWIENQTTYSDALDNLNRLLGRLLPPSAPPLSSKSLTISGGTIGYKTCRAMPVNGLPAIPSASTFLRLNSFSVSTDIVSTFSNGETGTLAAYLNDVISGSKLLSNNDDSGTYGNLVIVSDVTYPPNQPGFHQALSAKISGTVQPGLNKYKMVHTETGSIEIQFVYDNINIMPVTTTPIITQRTAGTLAYSSGIPHYTNSAILSIESTVSNISTLMFVPTNIVQITSGTNDTINLNPGDCGIPSILDTAIAPIALTNATYQFNNASHLQTQIGIRAANPSNTSAYNYASKKINVMNGSPIGGVNGPIMEMNIPVVNVGSKPTGISSDCAGRIVMSDGNTPVDDVSILTSPNWDSHVPHIRSSTDPNQLYIQNTARPYWIDYYNSAFSVYRNNNGTWVNINVLPSTDTKISSCKCSVYQCLTSLITDATHNLFSLTNRSYTGVITINSQITVSVDTNTDSFQTILTKINSQANANIKAALTARNINISNVPSVVYDFMFYTLDGSDLVIAGSTNILNILGFDNRVEAYMCPVVDATIQIGNITFFVDKNTGTASLFEYKQIQNYLGQTISNISPKWLLVGSNAWKASIPIVKQGSYTLAATTGSFTLNSQIINVTTTDVASVATLINNNTSLTQAGVVASILTTTGSMKMLVLSNIFGGNLVIGTQSGTTLTSLGFIPNTVVYGCSVHYSQSNQPSVSVNQDISILFNDNKFTIWIFNSTSRTWTKFTDVRFDESDSVANADYDVLLSENPIYCMIGTSTLPISFVFKKYSGSYWTNIGQCQIGYTDPTIVTPTSIRVLDNHDAVVVGGALIFDLTDYSSNYLPVGPDLSGRNPSQYITFMFRRLSASQFKIRVRGTYAGCWVKLPGIQNIPHSLNGWWDMFVTYSNAGVPGRDNNGPGCALGTPMTGIDIDAVCTFGTETSSDSTNNIILVRFKLTTGQKITGLSFEGA